MPGSALREHKARECGAQPCTTGRSLLTRSGSEGDCRASPTASSPSAAFGHKAFEQRAPSPANAGVPVRRNGQRQATGEASSSRRMAPPPLVGTRPAKVVPNPGSTGGSCRPEGPRRSSWSKPHRELRVRRSQTQAPVSCGAQPGRVRRPIVRPLPSGCWEASLPCALRAPAARHKGEHQAVRR